MVKRPNSCVLNAGDKFGKLEVVEYDSNKKAYLCKCECGGTTYAKSDGLKKGIHTSCKCYRRMTRPQTRKPENLAIRKSLYKTYKSSAIRRNHEFNLDFETFSTMIKLNCNYCDSEPSTIRQTHKDNTYTYNGIDRVDNSKGYTLDNIVTCCQKCNMSKRDLSIDEWFMWIRKVYSKTFND